MRVSATTNEPDSAASVPVPDAASAILPHSCELADAATPGPWRYNAAVHWRQPRSVSFEEFVGAGPPGDTVCVAATGPTDHPASMADARFIAAMDPVVAAALAVWLDDSASEAEQVGPNRFALALADVLLRSGTDPAGSA